MQLAFAGLNQSHHHRKNFTNHCMHFYFAAYHSKFVKSGPFSDSAHQLHISMYNRCRVIKILTYGTKEPVFCANNSTSLARSPAAGTARVEFGYPVPVTFTFCISFAVWRKIICFMFSAITFEKTILPDRCLIFARFSLNQSGMTEDLSILSSQTAENVKFALRHHDRFLRSVCYFS